MHFDFFHCCLSQLSIKTRIETKPDVLTMQIKKSLSQLSIKTRIETGKHHIAYKVPVRFESAIH